MIGKNIPSSSRNRQIPRAWLTVEQHHCPAPGVPSLEIFDLKSQTGKRKLDTQTLIEKCYGSANSVAATDPKKWMC
jgi:hypothetical protein